jgi:hypothetical protein
MSHNSRFIKVGEEVWNIDYIKRINCNDELCKCEFARYKINHLSNDNDDIVVAVPKDYDPDSYKSLKDFYDKF